MREQPEITPCTLISGIYKKRNFNLVIAMQRGDL